MSTARRMTVWGSALKLTLTATLTLGLVGGGLLLSGCGPDEVKQEDVDALQRTIEGYLPVLAAGYASGDLEPLKEFAAEKEVAFVFTRVSQLADEGKVLEPTFRRLTVEDANVWGYANGYMATLEVWDLRVYATGSGTLLSEELNQTSRVKYQLNRRGDRWQILYRELVQTIEEE